jgi:hypothetical protein
MKRVGIINLYVESKTYPERIVDVDADARDKRVGAHLADGH